MWLSDSSDTTTIATAPKVRYVWDLCCLDALAVRWRDADSSGSLEEKVYSCQDANANVTALVNERLELGPGTDYWYCSEAWQCLEERFLANTASRRPHRLLVLLSGKPT